MDPNKLREQRLQEKLEALEAWETARKQQLAEANEKDGGKSKADEGGFVSSLAEVVVNNLEVRVKRVHFRIEDAATKSVVGLLLNDVSLYTSNEKGARLFVDPSKRSSFISFVVFSRLVVRGWWRCGSGDNSNKHNHVTSAVCG